MPIFQQLPDVLLCLVNTIARAHWKEEFALVPREENCLKMDDPVKVEHLLNSFYYLSQWTLTYLVRVQNHCTACLYKARKYVVICM